MKGKYVDGFLLVIPKDKVEEYKKIATSAKSVWLKYGALDYKECMGEDLNQKGMEGMPPPRSFTEAAMAKGDETVWFSFIVFESRAHRDEVNAKVMKDPVMNDPAQQNCAEFMDMKRFHYGGFTVEVGA